jgi:hypothetical protein
MIVTLMVQSGTGDHCTVTAQCTWVDASGSSSSYLMVRKPMRVEPGCDALALLRAAYDAVGEVVRSANVRQTPSP